MTEAIESPCVSVCELTPGAKVCRGCHRTIEEIANWGRMSAEQRRAIMRELPNRKLNPVENTITTKITMEE